MTEGRTDASEVVGALVRQIELFSRRLSPIVTRINQVVQEQEPALRAVSQGIIYFSSWARYSELLKSAGWLPHRAMLYRELDELNGDTEGIRQLIQHHYRDNWQGIREEIEAGLSDCDIDEESKATFVEALVAHENGLYRSVCRVLLPEIERLVRVELTANETGSLRVHEIIEGLVDDSSMSLGDLLLGDIYNHDLFGRMRDHLYKRVDDANRQEFESDPVPNRHAAIHGVVSYSSEQNSLNTIFMADYLFRLIAFAKNISTEETDDDD